MPARCASFLPPSHPLVFPSLTRTPVARSSTPLPPVLPLSPPFRFLSFSLSRTRTRARTKSFLYFSFLLFQLTVSLFFYTIPSFFSSKLSLSLVFSPPTRPCVLHLFSTLSLSLSASLSRFCFVPFNSDRPFAKCAKRNLMGKGVEEKRRKERRTAKGNRKKGEAEVLGNLK